MKESRPTWAIKTSMKRGSNWRMRRIPSYHISTRSLVQTEAGNRQFKGLDEYRLSFAHTKLVQGRLDCLSPVS